ncbi:Steroid 5-alpha reductase family enzyme [Klenkia marina]|uniref:Steroid 5-alpha reductase family enzyme n=1 Tax=Klenkia marina TaxID=1960309 RepID=A0A1G4XZU3_9ACTN|nr:Steroid 5-alpha reductase family enzyme [Klenkia marina]
MVGVDWGALGGGVVVSSVVLLAVFTGTWLLALRLGRHSVVDVVWGLGFVVVALVGLLTARAGGHGDLGRQLLVLGLTAAWGVRLAVHIGRRNGDREDPRYEQIAARATGSVAAHLYRRVYLPQTVVLFAVSLPLLVAAFQDGAATSGWPLVVVLLGVLVWSVGFTFETVGDWQLERFKADPANRGRVNDLGLWRYTRHPNYFGDACVMWGLWLPTAAHWSGWVFVVCPVLMTLNLVKGSGAAMTDKRMRSTREGFAEYVERTSGFVPWFPRS